MLHGWQGPVFFSWRPVVTYLCTREIHLLCSSVILLFLGPCLEHFDFLKIKHTGYGKVLSNKGPLLSLEMQRLEGCGMWMWNEYPYHGVHISKCCPLSCPNQGKKLKSNLFSHDESGCLSYKSSVGKLTISGSLKFPGPATCWNLYLSSP